MPTLPTVVQGDTYSVTVSLLKDGATYPSADLVDAVGTFSIVERAHPATKSIEDKSFSIDSDASTGTLVFTAAETALLRVHPDPTKSVMHVADLKIDEFGSPIVTTQPFFMPVRKRIS